jgi:hypothetical protein
MRSQPVKFIRVAGAALIAWLGSCILEATECRGCGKTVTPWEDTCPKCGTAGPSRISPQRCAILVGVPAFFLLAYVTVKLVA